MKLNPHSKDAIKQFEHIERLYISKNNDDGFLDLFLFPINSRNFDYDSVSDKLLESLAEYAFSWKEREEYLNKGGMIYSKKARERFINYSRNKAEIGELLLFCFLEGHLEAPKILTKLRLKTSNNQYVNGSDGVHLKKVSNQKYHLIFGESKVYKDLDRALKDAFKSISEFKNEINSKGEEKSGISFEKGLISSNLERDIFDDDEEELIKLLGYPGNKSNLEIKPNLEIKLEDAFSIFIIYEIDILEEREKCLNDEFPNKIKEKIINQVSKKKSKIYNLIQKHNNLLGHTFYIFIMPYDNIEENTGKMTKGCLK